MDNGSPRTDLLCAVGGGLVILAGIALSQDSAFGGMAVEDIGAVPLLLGAGSPIYRSMGILPAVFSNSEMSL